MSILAVSDANSIQISLFEHSILYHSILKDATDSLENLLLMFPDCHNLSFKKS